MADPTAIADPAALPLRPARPDEIGRVHGWLGEAIRTSPFYGDEFKAYESQRLSRGYLEAMAAADPWHVAIIEDRGEPAGFIMSGPELGTLWLHWCYLVPERRQSSAGLASVRAFVKHWNNGRFHKIAAYTKPDNRAARAVMVRLGFEEIALLRQHIFGEDYLLYERALTKLIPGYDHGAPLGRLAGLKRRAGRIIGR